MCTGLLLLGVQDAAGAKTGQDLHHSVTVTIAAKSADPVVTGDVWVIYHSSKRKATVSGRATGLSGSPVAELLASKFPFHGTKVLARDLLNLNSGTANFIFSEAPAVATRYSVEIAASSSVGAPIIGHTNTVVVYVTYTGTVSPPSAPPCARPTCHLTYTVKELLPPSVVKFESNKRIYWYFGVNYSPTAAEPPPPKTLTLRNQLVSVTGEHVLVATGAFVFTFSFSFPIDNESWRWALDFCTKDTESVDGIGLPGHHGCGNASLPHPTPYHG